MLQLAVTTLKQLRRILLGIPLDGDPNSRDRRIQALRLSAPELETFIEPDPRKIPLLSLGMVFDWMRSFFPFPNWLFKYQREWIIGDLVAGLTVGIVVIPQGMAYAKLAELPVEFGLYGSFMGVLIYWMFATSKDITIGPVAVMSSLMGEIVRQAAITSPEIPGHVVASSLALLSGCIIFTLDPTPGNRCLFDELSNQHYRGTSPHDARHLSPIRYSRCNLSNHHQYIQATTTYDN